jgi:hypothetical protein
MGHMYVHHHLARNDMVVVQLSKQTDNVCTMLSELALARTRRSWIG